MLASRTNIGSDGDLAIRGNGESLVKVQHCPATVRSSLQVRMPAESQIAHILRGTDRKIMKDKHTIFVCESCAGVWKDSRQVGNSGGYLLLSELTDRVTNWPLAEEFEIEGVKCMGACNRPCAIAFAAPHKSTYLFGDLNHSDSLTDISTDVLACAAIYHQAPDGAMPWSARPERLKKGLIGRVPSC
jgi:predicted metal-binding protein